MPPAVGWQSILVHRRPPYDDFIGIAAERVTGPLIDREERLDMSKPGPSDHAPVVVDLAN